jgi:hypothetical protein
MLGMISNKTLINNYIKMLVSKPYLGLQCLLFKHYGHIILESNDSGNVV